LSSSVYNLSTWKIEIFSKNDVKFSYRSSIFKESENYFIIKAKFDLSSLQEKYSSDVDNIKFREEIQPKWNSCWSFFKNPSREFSAWKLIEEVWLKWFTHKTAYFSDKHANFLMTNTDNWDYKDLIYLIDLAKSRVKEKFGFDLEPEVRIIC
jgi:UDP-N-acetylmuramate dehydrogenase